MWPTEPPTTATSTPSGPLVFLDIDGVLLPFGEGAPDAPPSPALFQESCLQALSLLLEETGSTLVLSSTWRASTQYMRDAVADFHRFAAVHGGPLGELERFAHTTSCSAFTVRQHEIAEWLARNGGAAHTAWVALDDEPLLQGKACEKHRNSFVDHVVQTRSEVGLTESGAREAVRLLREQQQRLRRREGRDCRKQQRVVQSRGGKPSAAARPSVLASAAAPSPPLSVDARLVEGALSCSVRVWWDEPWRKTRRAWTPPAGAARGVPRALALSAVLDGGDAIATTLRAELEQRSYVLLRAEPPAARELRRAEDLLRSFFARQESARANSIPNPDLHPDPA
jgi:hypothetical protein